MNTTTLPPVGSRVEYARLGFRARGEQVYSGTVIESPSSNPNDSATCLLVRPDAEFGADEHHVTASSLLVDGKRVDDECPYGRPHHAGPCSACTDS